MDSRHLVDPELRPMLEVVPSFATGVEALAASREMVDAMPVEELPAGVERSEVAIPRADGGSVRALVHRSSGAAPRLALLHLHPGGFILGRPEMRDARNAALALEPGAVVVSIDYRKAPEHPYPAALEDALAAWRWIRAEVASGLPVALLGESAGGGLAASLTHRLVDLGEPLPALQALIYPMLDPRSSADGAAAPHLGEFVWTRANNRFAWEAYLGPHGKAEEAAPAFRASLAGLPPTFLLVGGLDLFLEEDLDYARRLMLAGVPTQLHVLPGAYHGFDMAGPTAAERTMSHLLLQALEAVAAR